MSFCCFLICALLNVFLFQDVTECKLSFFTWCLTFELDYCALMSFLISSVSQWEMFMHLKISAAFIFRLLRCFCRCNQRNQARYLLRPETVESLFYMFYVTGNEQYRKWAWAIFTSLRRYARVDGGYAVVENVNSLEADSDSLNPRHSDQMDSYFLSETLKYLYLIFAEQPQNVLSLRQFLLNTEAHLLPVYSR